MEIEHTIVDTEMHIYVDTRRKEICKSDRVIKLTRGDYQVGETLENHKNIVKKQKYHEYISVGYVAVTPEKFEEDHSPKTTIVVTKNKQPYYQSMWSNLAFT